MNFQFISFQAQLSLVIHGETRSKELAHLLKKYGLGVSYADVLDLEAATKLQRNILGRIMLAKYLQLS